MNTKDWWAGEGGDAYTARNRVNWVQRIPFWTDMLARTRVNSIFELGCNFGANLLALRAVNPEIQLRGEEINPSAIREAHALGLTVYNGFAYAKPPIKFGLTFTAGVLIHVGPDDLRATMSELVEKSLHYVLAIEYDAATEEEVVYRGERGLLWKRNYGKLYEELGCRELMSGYLKAEDGFDNCTWWLMEKQGEQEGAEVILP